MTSGIVISVSDGTLSASLPAFNLTVVNVNDAPTISGTPSTSVKSRQAYRFAPTAADVDSNTNLTFSISNKPSWATFDVGTGVLSGTPSRAQVGITSGIVISVSDGSLTASLPAFNLEVQNDNTAPRLTARTVQVDEDSSVSVELKGVDDEGDTLSYELTSQPQHGAVERVGDAFNYIPSANFNGEDVFSVIAKDEGLSSAPALVTVQVAAVNDHPDAVDDSYNLVRAANDNYLLDVLGNDSDVDADAVIIDGSSSSLGTVSFSDAGLRLQTPANYVGAVDLRYTVTDGHKGRAQANVSVLINGQAGDGLPVITVPATVNSNATSLFTKVDLGTATAMDSAGKPLAVSLVSGNTFFAPGANLAYWQATDSSGRKAVKSQRVNITPLVSLGKDLDVTENQRVVVKVLLNGPAPSYPVRVPYSVSGTATPADHSLADGVLDITEGTEGQIVFDVLPDNVQEGMETIVIRLGNDVNRGSQAQTTIRVREDNIAPSLTISVLQQNQQKLTVAKNQGLVTVVATVHEMNPQDTVSRLWQAPTLTGVSIAEDVLSFDPAAQSVGVHVVSLTATDNGTPALRTVQQVYIVVVPSLPTLGNQDSDGDLIPDSQEGFADSDGDGIPDYLDRIAECNVVPEVGAEQGKFLAEGAPGVCLRRGQSSVLASSGGLQLGGNEVATDAQASNIGGIYDFIAYGLPNAGQDYALVLPQRLPVPANAVYRKYTSAGGWKDFTINAKNFVSSTIGERGFCPPPGAAAWSKGLQEGAWCVQVTIEDGGPNDADGLVNGSIVDPSGVAVPQSSNRLPVAVADTASTRIGFAIDVNVLKNDSDADADLLSVSQVSAQFGQVVILPSMELRYTPPANFAGSDVLVYSVTDGKGGTASAELTVSVVPNNAVVTSADTAATDDRSYVYADVKANDVDPDGDVFTLVSVSAQKGAVSITADQKVRYIPLTGYEGSDKVTYVVQDAFGARSEGVLTVSIKAYQEVTVKNQSRGGGASGLWSVLVLSVLALWRRKGRVVVLLPALCWSQAQASDWQLQLDYGGTQAFKTAAELQPSQGQLLGYDNNDQGYRISVGYHVAPALAVQLGYMDFGRASADIQGATLTPTQYHQLVNTLSPTLGQAVSVGVEYDWFTIDKVQIAVGTGLAQWSTDIESRMGTSTLITELRGADLYFRASARYRVSDTVELGIGWQQNRFANNSARLTGLSLRWRF